MKKLLVFAAVLSAASLPVLAQTTIPAMKTSVTAGERATASYFVQDSVGDVQLGQLGLAKAHDPSVRELATAMVTDHGRTADAGLQVAKQLGGDDVQFKAGDDNQIQISHLARYSGAQFDREYASALVEAHKTDISTAQDALEFATTPALRSYLNDSIAVDKRHLQMALSAQAKVGKGG